MYKKKVAGGVLTLSSLILLAACSPSDSDKQNSVDTNTQSSETVVSSNASSQMTKESESANEMEEMEHDDSGEIPAGLKEAQEPLYPIGDTVTIHTDHMEGMDGAKGTVVGAFDTVAYEVTYKSEKDDSLVKNHKWVIKEEIPKARNQEQPLSEGTEVTLEADHMEGMKGATATIDSAEDTTVYMIDYQPTTGGEVVKNHKWVVEDELSEK